MYSKTKNLKVIRLSWPQSRISDGVKDPKPEGDDLDF